MRKGPELFAIGLIVAGIFVASVTLVRATLWDPDQSVSGIPMSASSGSAVHVATSSLPARLRIPVLGISAKVKPVGVNAEGNMATPGNFTDVAWYQYGTVPGQVGSAVMDGHVDNGLSLPGVFKHLSELTVGSDIYIDTKAGTTLHFVVEDVEQYPYLNVPAEYIFNRHDTARLNLITCDGVWVAGKKTYDHRLVIFAVLKP